MDSKIAVIGDIVASRRLMDRNAFQIRLSRVLDSLNGRKKGIDSPYTITIGDEFQALLSSAQHLLRDAIAIAEGIAPVRVRISAGVGEIATAINRKLAVGMDGPAFHLAREGLEKQKRNRRGGDALRIFAVYGLKRENAPAALLESSLGLFSSAVYKLSPTPIRILSGLYDKKDIAVLASELGISIQSVYKHVRSHALGQMVEFMRDYEHTLDDYLKSS